MPNREPRLTTADLMKSFSKRKRKMMQPEGQATGQGNQRVEGTQPTGEQGQKLKKRKAQGQGEQSTGEQQVGKETATVKRKKMRRDQAGQQAAEEAAQTTKKNPFLE
jgi:hypothetical protein